MILSFNDQEKTHIWNLGCPDILTFWPDEGLDDLDSGKYAFVRVNQAWFQFIVTLNPQSTLSLSLFQIVVVLKTGLRSRVQMIHTALLWNQI